MAAGAEWVVYRENDEMVFYYDPATIRKDGNLRRVWGLQDLKQRNKDGYLSLRALTEFDCENERARTLSSSVHSGAMAGGKVLYTETTKTPQWNYIPPGTVAEVLFRRVCK